MRGESWRIDNEGCEDERRSWVGNHEEWYEEHETVRGNWQVDYELFLG